MRPSRTRASSSASVSTTATTPRKPASRSPRSRPSSQKGTPAIRDPGEPILRPRGSKQLDWEVELGVVIGRTARFVPRERALDYVAGYTNVNDVSARDFQFITSQWAAGK